MARNVPEPVATYADMMSAMGTEPRLRIMRLLLSAHPAGLVVGEIQDELGITGSTLSHHLEKLKNEDLVRVQREGTFPSGTRRTRTRWGLCSPSSTRSAARAARRSSPKPSPGSADSAGDGVFSKESGMADIKDVVKEKYGKAALRVVADQGAACCGPSCCSSVPGAVDPITVNLYDQRQTEGLPAEAVLASLGCGNPTALASLSPGEVVLDLGSGGGIDVFLSAKRVGPSGKAYGLDMTDEMLALARENQRKAGVENVEFLKGEIEHIPLPDNSCGRDHLELRHQPVGRQGPRPRRGVPRPEAGRPLRRVGCGGAWGDSAGDPPQCGVVGRVPCRRPRRIRLRRPPRARWFRTHLHRAHPRVQGGRCEGVSVGAWVRR